MNRQDCIARPVHNIHIEPLVQSVTFANENIAYGGTTHSPVGNTEVYMSYDYSTFIRDS